MKRIQNKKLILILCFITGMVMQIQMAANGRMGPEAMMQLGPRMVPLSSINGVLQAVMFFMCVFMVCLEYKLGSKLAHIVMVVNLIVTFVGLLASHNLTAVTGMICTLVSLFTLQLITVMFRQSERTSVTDFVTGLKNRRGFVKDLAVKLSENKSGAILYLQLKDFRTINDNLGHKYGDRILIKVAEKIKEVTGNQGVVCKIDGAEFALILNKGVDVNTLSRQIMDTVNEEIAIEKNGVEMNYYLSAYAGIARFPEDARDTDTLMKYADIAMLSAIKEGDNKIRIFGKEMETLINRQAEVEGLVKKGLENDYFFLVFQPQYVINNRKLRGFEALIRMKLPDGTMISPGEFIPIAEQTDLILKIDEYVLKKAMDTYGGLLKYAKFPFTVSVNVSAKSMGMEGFAEQVLKIADETEFPKECLEIEITEYSFAASKNQTIENVKKLREKNVQIALDDFGTGYTSLSQLLELPINLLKIDKSLIDEIEGNEKNMDFVDAVIYMGHLMGCEVISEGVENEKQLELLKAHECEFVQGYVWSKPLSYEDAMKEVEKQQITFYS